MIQAIKYWSPKGSQVALDQILNSCNEETGSDNDDEESGEDGEDEWMTGSGGQSFPLLTLVGIN